MIDMMLRAAFAAAVLVFVTQSYFVVVDIVAYFGRLYATVALNAARVGNGEKPEGKVTGLQGTVTHVYVAGFAAAYIGWYLVKF